MPIPENLAAADQYIDDVIKVAADQSKLNPLKTRGVQHRQLLKDLLRFLSTGGLTLEDNDFTIASLPTDAEPGVFFALDAESGKLNLSERFVKYLQANFAKIGNLAELDVPLEFQTDLVAAINYVLENSSFSVEQNDFTIEPDLGDATDETFAAFEFTEDGFRLTERFIKWLKANFGPGSLTPGDGTIQHVHWQLTSLSQKTFTLPESFPDIRPDMPVSLHIGGHPQLKGFDYSFTTRAVTVIGEYNPDITQTGDYVQFVYDVGSGVTSPPGGNGPAFTISAGTGVSFTPGAEQVPGVPDITINAVDVKVVTNQVDAANPIVVPDTIMVATNAAGNDIKSSAKKIVAARLVPVPASQSSPGLSGQMARNTTTGDKYSYDYGQWWWDTAPTAAQRKTFTT